MTERPRSSWGIIGLCLVGAVAALSAIGPVAASPCVLIPFGVVGLALCAAGLADRPGWPAVAGLVLAIACVAVLVGSHLKASRTANQTSWSFGATDQQLADSSKRVTEHAAKFGLTVEQHSEMSMAAMDLAVEAERQRLPDGTPAQVVVLKDIPVDPWHREYRYVLNATPRGFTYVSDGPDGIPNTSDDIDLFTIQDGAKFSLPPISKR